jgi:hypothetical protein
MLLVSGLSLVFAACARVPPTPSVARATRGAEFDGWRQGAQGMLSDALEALRKFDRLYAFRASTTMQASTPIGCELAWDPPTSAAWDETTHVARGFPGWEAVAAPWGVSRSEPIGRAT